MNKQKFNPCCNWVFIFQSLFYSFIITPKKFDSSSSKRKSCGFFKNSIQSNKTNGVMVQDYIVFLLKYIAKIRTPATHAGQPAKIQTGLKLYIT